MKKSSTPDIKQFLRQYWQLLVLVTMVIVGIILHFMEVLDWRQLMTWAGGYTQYWWTAVLLILLQIVLYTFALPGSVILWVVAPLYPPVTATIMLVTGCSVGALCAYIFARRETLALSERVKDSHFFHLLETRGDFLSLLALRVMPSFPHSVINYGAGILHISPGIFMLSTVISFTLKVFLYTHAIHGAVTAADPSELVRIEVIGPLIFLALLFTLAELLRIRWVRIHAGGSSQ